MSLAFILLAFLSVVKAIFKLSSREWIDNTPFKQLILPTNGSDNVNNEYIIVSHRYYRIWGRKMDGGVPDTSPISAWAFDARFLDGKIFKSEISGGSNFFSQGFQGGGLRLDFKDGYPQGYVYYDKRRGDTDNLLRLLTYCDDSETAHLEVPKNNIGVSCYMILCFSEESCNATSALLGPIPYGANITAQNSEETRYCLTLDAPRSSDTGLSKHPENPRLFNEIGAQACAVMTEDRYMVLRQRWSIFKHGSN